MAPIEVRCVQPESSFKGLYLPRLVVKSVLQGDISTHRTYTIHCDNCGSDMRFEIFPALSFKEARQLEADVWTLAWLKILLCFAFPIMYISGRMIAHVISGSALEVGNAVSAVLSVIGCVKAYGMFKATFRHFNLRGKVTYVRKGTWPDDGFKFRYDTVFHDFFTGGHPFLPSYDRDYDPSVRSQFYGQRGASGLSRRSANTKGPERLVDLAASGQTRAVLALLKKVKDPTARATLATKALNSAILAQRFETVRGLIAWGVQVDSGFTNDDPPLVRAVSSGQVTIVKALLEAGADPRLPDRFGMTPLEIAQKQGLTQIVAILRPYYKDLTVEQPGERLRRPAEHGGAGGASLLGSREVAAARKTDKRATGREGGRSDMASRCYKCGKQGLAGGQSGEIVIASPERFEDMVGKCQSCGAFVCGACANKVDMTEGFLYQCPKCGGSIGPG